MKSLEEIKRIVMKWSGFELEGETEADLIRSVGDISYQLQCEISDQEKGIRKLIQELDIEEGV